MIVMIIFHLFSHDTHTALCPTTCQDGDGDGGDNDDDTNECSDNDDGERSLSMDTNRWEWLNWFCSYSHLTLKSSFLSFFWRKNQVKLLKKAFEQNEEGWVKAKKKKIEETNEKQSSETKKNKSKENK